MAATKHHKTSAWPLAQAYAALIFYASLYPFTGWRDQGIAPWAFLLSPWPRYWTGFDVAANVVGYAPLGFLLALAVLRRGKVLLLASRPRTAAVATAVLSAAVLALSMEALQSYLPSRVASNVDFGLNVAGALAGAAMAAGLEAAGAIDRWSRFRTRWFVDDARGALVLLALWPFALLFPAAVPLGLGQVFERLESALVEWLQDTPFLEWLPVRDIELQPLVPGTELLCVALGALIPCLLGYSVMRSISRRAVLAGVLVALGLAASALSAALSYGPAHAWAWLSLPVRLGLAFGLLLALALLAV
ncbi:MAG TPA: VanZ family protein, partial [Ramlibacter sp.]|nr:VanZ family protein [Ramlibacter sp.]